MGLNLGKHAFDYLKQPDKRELADELERLLALIIHKQGGEIKIDRREFLDSPDLTVEYCNQQTPTEDCILIRTSKKKPAFSASDPRKVMHPLAVLDGSYEGNWSGYQVKFKVGGDEYEVKTTDGVRGLNVPCTVTIKNGEITVQPK